MGLYGKLREKSKNKQNDKYRKLKHDSAYFFLKGKVEAERHGVQMGNEASPLLGTD